MKTHYRMLLRQAREEHGWSQKDVAEKVGTDAKTVSRWERRVAFPSPYFRQKLAALFEKSPRELDLLDSCDRNGEDGASTISKPSAGSEGTAEHLELGLQGAIPIQPPASEQASAALDQADHPPDAFRPALQINPTLQEPTPSPEPMHPEAVVPLEADTLTSSSEHTSPEAVIPPTVSTETRAPHHGWSRRAVVGMGVVGATLIEVGGLAAWLKLARPSQASSQGANTPVNPTPVPSRAPTPPLLVLTQSLYTYRGHSRGLDRGSLAWSPDGSRIASGGRDGLQVWDALTGANAKSFDRGRIVGVTWSPDGKTLALSATTGEMKVVNAATGAIANAPFKGNPTSLASSPGGRQLVGGAGDHEPFVQVWSWQAGGNPTLWQGHRGEVWCAAWSPDGKYVASGGADQTVIVWEAARGIPFRELFSQFDIVWSIAWSPDSTHVVSGHQDHMVVVWDIVTRTRLLTYAGHKWAVQGVAWSPDGRRIASCSTDRTAHVWDAATGKLLVIYKGHDSDVTSIAWSPDGKYVATGSADTTVQVWQPG